MRAMRKHRGPAPEDVLFHEPGRMARLRQAVSDLSWLLHRGYSAKAASELVGNRYQLRARERLALSPSFALRKCKLLKTKDSVFLSNYKKYQKR